MTIIHFSVKPFFSNAEVYLRMKCPERMKVAWISGKLARKKEAVLGKPVAITAEAKLCVEH